MWDWSSRLRILHDRFKAAIQQRVWISSETTNDKRLNALQISAAVDACSKGSVCSIVQYYHFKITADNKGSCEGILYVRIIFISVQ